MKKELNNYAICSFNHEEGLGVASIVDDNAKVRSIEIGETESHIIIETTKPVNPGKIDTVTVAYIYGKVKQFYSGKITGIKRTRSNTVLYRISFETEKTITTPSKKIMKFKNEMIEKFKGSITARPAKKEESAKEEITYEGEYDIAQ